MESNCKLSTAHRTAKFIISAANTIVPVHIGIKYDIPDNNNDGWFPVLDLQPKVNGDKISTKIYKKPMATNKEI